MVPRRRRHPPRKVKSTSASWYQLATFVFALVAILIFYSELSSGVSGCFFSVSGRRPAPQKSKYGTSEEPPAPTSDVRQPAKPPVSPSNRRDVTTPRLGRPSPTPDAR